MRRLVILLPLLLSGCLGVAGIPLYVALVTLTGYVLNDATQVFTTIEHAPGAATKP